MNEEWLLKMGAIAASVLGIGSLIMAVYQKLIIVPYNRANEIRRKESTDQLTEALTPLTGAIDRLNYLLDQSEKDRKILHELNKKQDEKLGEHEIKIVVLDNFRKEHLKYHNRRDD